MQLTSKLPHVGLTIFGKMSQMAHEHQAINLSQGFPDFEVAPELIACVHHYMQQGKNQYPPMMGIPELRKAIAQKIQRCHDWLPDTEQHIMVTCGAIEAIFSSLTALVHPGDEVILMDPAYDAYEPIVHLQGAKAIHVPLKEKNYAIDWEAVERAISPKTRMIMINTPHNPSGAIISKDDLVALERLTEGTDILILSDEVYEHIVFDGNEHHSVLRSAALRKRAVATFSFGKTFHATGWRMGYLVAPEVLMAEIKKVHQYNTFTIHAPTQYALADYLQTPAHYENLGAMYQEKRDVFLKAMEVTDFEPVPSKGSYFQLMSYANISDRHDVEMAEWLTKEIGVASIPTSVFHADGRDDKVLRFCFAKQEDTLKKAAEMLSKCFV